MLAFVFNSRHNSVDYWRFQVQDRIIIIILYNWLVDFFSNCQHLTKQNQEKSAILSINSSVVQGSGMGPVMYIVNASDLHPTCSPALPSSFCNFGELCADADEKLFFFLCVTIHIMFCINYIMLKYADDTYLIVPYSSTCQFTPLT